MAADETLNETRDDPTGDNATGDDVNATGGCTRYPAPRALQARERAHPLAESGWMAVGQSVFEDQVDTLLLEKNGKHRLIEFYDDYAWCSQKRCLAWEEFLTLETESGDRRGWTASIAEKLDCYGHAVPNPKVWVARNEDFGADWLLGLEF